LVTGPIGVLKDGFNYMKGGEKGVEDKLREDTTLFTISKDSLKDGYTYFRGYYTYLKDMAFLLTG
jgi:hypothetical protein